MTYTMSIPELYQARRDAAERVRELEAELDRRWLEACAYWQEYPLTAVAPAGSITRIYPDGSQSTV